MRAIHLDESKQSERELAETVDALHHLQEKEPQRFQAYHRQIFSDVIERKRRRKL
jgi:hypothetical protein